MEHSFPSSRYIPVPKIDKKSIQNTHTTRTHKKKLHRSIERKKHYEFLTVCLIFELHRPSPFLFFVVVFFCTKKHAQQKRKILMSKSDALATKEMPFRVYMGYDSHEDITFEVRATRCSSSIRRTTSSVFCCVSYCVLRVCVG